MTPVIYHLILTVVILICFGLGSRAANGAPIDATAKWLIYVIIVIITVLAILHIWWISA